MSTQPVSDEDFSKARVLFLGGLASGTDVADLVAAAHELHPRRNTFPGEVFMELAGEALAAARQVEQEGLLDTFLPEVPFHGRDRYKVRSAVLMAAASAGGLEPDLFEDVARWQTDDFWRYSLLAGVALVRAAARIRGVHVSVVVEELASTHGIVLDDSGRAGR